MTFVTRAKKSVVWIVLICMLAINIAPMFIYAENGPHTLMIGEQLYELENEPYQNSMGLILSARELVGAFGLEYVFDDTYKSFEIICEDSKFVFMHEATHYYKNDESFECLPYFFVENGPMIELGMFCEIFGKQYSYAEDSKAIIITEKETKNPDIIPDTNESADDNNEDFEAVLEKYTPTEIIEETKAPLITENIEDTATETQDENLENDLPLTTETTEAFDNIDEAESKETISEDEAVITQGDDESENTAKVEDEQEESESVSLTAITRTLSGTLYLEKQAPPAGLKVEFILQPISNLISQTYGTSYYELEDAYSLGTISFYGGETEKNYAFETSQFYTNSYYPKYCIYVKIIKNGILQAIRYISDYDYMYEASEILTYTQITSYTPIRKFSFGRNELLDFTLPGVDYAESTISGRITLPGPAPQGGLEISLILQAVSNLKTTSYGVDYYSTGYAYNIGTLSFDEGETIAEYEFEIDQYYDNLDYPNYFIYYNTDINNYFERYGCYQTTGTTKILSYAPLNGDIRKSLLIKAFEFGKTDMADIYVSSLTHNLCGPNANWSFDSDNGVLTISGTGEIYDYYDFCSPWFQSSVAHVVIEDGITSIGEFAFYGLSNLRTLTLPQSLERIGSYSFAGCNKLLSVSLPEGVQIIEPGAFSDCKNLTTLFLPKTLSRIEMQAFDGCYNLTDVFYNGNEEDWDNLWIQTQNTYLFDADIIYTESYDNLFKEDSQAMIINGKNCMSESTPIWYNGKLFAPVRPVADSVGANAEWNQSTKVLKFTKSTRSVSYTNSSGSLLNSDGRVYIAIEDVWNDFLSFGCEYVTWRSGMDKWCIASSNNIPVITMDKVNARAGNLIDVSLYIENNPGLAGLQLKLLYDNNLTLEYLSWNGDDALSDLEFTPPGNLNYNPLTLIWDGISADDSNGRILTLTFSTDSYIGEGFYPIWVETIQDGVYDENLENITCSIVNGGITILNYIPGDINGDGVVTTKDVTSLRRYIAGGYNVTVVTEALDVNGDGTVTTKDVTTLRRIIAGGYGI